MFLLIAQPGEQLNADGMVWTSCARQFSLAKYECYHYENLFVSSLGFNLIRCFLMPIYKYRNALCIGDVVEIPVFTGAMVLFETNGFMVLECPFPLKTKATQRADEVNKKL
uniref:Uncharacterized protein n=1 Tax=Setaria viridis TaxID=4556 RepID=A0A4U6TXI6_SETVI|nr:hypothetical protein SEVIR_7G234800v2 [Setaria viridis]